MRFLKRALSLLLMLVLTLSLSVSFACSDKIVYTFNLKDNGELIANKGMGWNFCYYSNSLSGYGDRLAQGDYLDDFPCDIVYFRIGWNFIQPDDEFYHKVLSKLDLYKDIVDPSSNQVTRQGFDESRLNDPNYYYWDVLDRVTENWIENGKRVAFRIVLSDGWGQCTPLWIKDLGCDGVEYDPITEGSIDKLTKKTDENGQPIVDDDGKFVYTDESMETVYNGFTVEGKDWYGSVDGWQIGDWGKGRKTWCPNYGDDILITHYTRFLENLRDHFDEHIEFIEIGSIGTWGEGHYNRALPTRPFLTKEAKRKHLDMHYKVFGNNYTVIAWDYLGVEDDLMEVCMQYGFGCTDDSLQVPGMTGYNYSTLIQFYDEGNYVGLETHPNTLATKVYYDAVVDCHASYARLLIAPEEQKGSEFYEPITKRLGYRIVFTEIGLGQFKPGKDMNVVMKLKNTGVAPCYVGGNPMIVIKDDYMNIVATSTSTFNVRNLPVVDFDEDLEFQETIECSLRVSIPKDLEQGKYSIYVGVADSNGEPSLNLPLDDGYNKLYRFATFEI